MSYSTTTTLTDVIECEPSSSSSSSSSSTSSSSFSSSESNKRLIVPLDSDVNSTDNAILIDDDSDSTKTDNKRTKFDLQLPTIQECIYEPACFSDVDIILPQLNRDTIKFKLHKSIISRPNVCDVLGTALVNNPMCKELTIDPSFRFTFEQVKMFFDYIYDVDRTSFKMLDLLKVVKYMGNDSIIQVCAKRMEDMKHIEEECTITERLVCAYEFEMKSLQKSMTELLLLNWNVQMNLSHHGLDFAVVLQKLSSKHLTELLLKMAQQSFYLLPTACATCKVVTAGRSLIHQYGADHSKCYRRLG